MQKMLQTVDGKTIYINIEPPRYIERTTQYPLPNWHVIYDETNPAARVEKIDFPPSREWVRVHLWHAPEPNTVLVLPIHITDFIDLLFPGLTTQMSLPDCKDVSRLLADILILLWQERQEAEEAE